MTRSQTLTRTPSPTRSSRLADAALDIAVPAMAALLTLGIFLLAVR